MPSVNSFQQALTRWGWAIIVLVAAIASFIEPTPERMRIMWIVMIVTLSALVIRMTWRAIKKEEDKDDVQ